MVQQSPIAQCQGQNPHVRYNSTKMFLTRHQISELLLPFAPTLSSEGLEAIAIYIDLLLKWNARMNLTAVRDPEAIVTRHFGESLFAARHLFPEPVAASVADIGSGAGFPGIPIKIWNQAAGLTLIEANQRKAVFLREVIRSLKLRDVSIVSARVETLGLTADVVTIRAVERFYSVLQPAKGLVTSGGRLALLIGESQVAIATALDGLIWQKPIPVPLSRSRRLLIGTTR